MSSPQPSKPYQSSQLAAWLAPKDASRTAIAEALILLLVALMLAWWWQPNDPLLINQGFPWLWLVPIILALRYGTIVALLTAVLLASSWFLFHRSGVYDTAFPNGFFLGGLITLLVTGEFADIWTTRLRRIRSINAYTNEILNSLTYRHHLLHLAYSRLEQELLVKPITLRDALQRLRRLMVDDDSNSQLPKAEQFLQLLSQSCQLGVVSFYAVDNHSPSDRLASIGKVSDIDVHDPLVAYAMLHQQLSHIQTDALDDPGSRYLLVAPVVNSSDEVIGLILVEQMPFLSMNDDNLRFFSMLVGYYADAAVLSSMVPDVLSIAPECRLLFAGELVRLHRIYQEIGIPSMLTALIIAPSLQQEGIEREALRQSRKPDLTWEFGRDGTRYVLTLMALHGDAAHEGYLRRTEHWFKDIFGVTDFSDVGVSLHSVLVGSVPPATLLQNFLQLCETGDAPSGEQS